MKVPFQQQRQLRYGAFVGLYLVVVLAILSAANYLADRYNKTYDATSNKLYTLSDQTKKVVGNLKQDVKFLYFDKTESFSSSRFGPSPKDMLTRYANLSPRVTVEYVDPVRKPKVAQDYKISATGTTIVEVAGRREEAKGLSEEQLTNALIRAMKVEKRTACFVAGHGEPALDDTGRQGFSGIKDALESNNYTTKSITLQEKDATVPKDCTVLVEAGPRTDLVEPETEAMKKFVEGGGRALFMLSPPTKGITTAALEKLLADWAVTADHDLVVDLSGVGQLFGGSELSPLVASYEGHAITKEMGRVPTIHPLVRSLVPGTGKDKVSIEKLYSTSAKSFAVTDLSSPELKIDPKKDKPGPHCLAVAGTYRGEGSAQGRFVVTGSALLVSNQVLGFPVANSDLFLNMMSWLSSDEDLISIRPKEPEDRRLMVSAAQMNTLLITNVFGIPILILGCGVFVWWRRR